MPDEFVFVGPSLPADEVAALRPGATILPPVEHGDLLRLPARAGDRVFIIDGLFMRAAPVRHREILLLLERGVTVAGSSSMGALRAAELWPLGMRGVGEVFRMYRDGEVTGDDEVAVVHGPAEDGYRPLSVPMVNIRVALRRAVAAGVVTADEAATLADLVRAMPFRQRGYRALERAAWDAGASICVDRFLSWHRADPTDAKGDDAREMLALPADGPDAPAPHGPADRRIDNVHTAFLRAWQARHGGEDVDDRWVTDAQAITALMLLHPGFPAAHRRAVLARLVPDAAPADVDVAALAAARDRGLLGDAPDRSAACWRWLTPAEHDLPQDEAVLRVLCRAFGTVVPESVARWIVPPVLDDEDTLAAARASVATAQRLNERLPRVDPILPDRRKRFRPEVVDRTFRDLWGCDADLFDAEIRNRGFIDRDVFRVVAEPLVLYVKVFGRSTFDGQRSVVTPAA
jgi:hypothetical protein